MDFAIVLLGILVSYAAVTFCVWSLCRMMAWSNRLAEHRANIIPFKRV